MQLHSGCPNFELWLTESELPGASQAALKRIAEFLRRCAGSLEPFFAVDHTNRVLQLSLDCVGAAQSLDEFKRLRQELIDAFTQRMTLLRRQGLYTPQLPQDGLRWCTTVRGPFLEVTDPTLIEAGLTLPRVCLESRCQTVGLSLFRAREHFPSEYAKMAIDPHTPAVVLQLWLNVSDGSRLERHRRELDSLAADLTTLLGATLVTHRRTVVESF